MIFSQIALLMAIYVVVSSARKYDDLALMLIGVGLALLLVSLTLEAPQ